MAVEWTKVRDYEKLFTKNTTESQKLPLTDQKSVTRLRHYG